MVHIFNLFHILKVVMMMMMMMMMMIITIRARLIRSTGNLDPTSLRGFQRPSASNRCAVIKGPLMQI